MDTSASNRRLRTLLTAIGNGSLIPQPDFQRRLVWTNKDKIEFIRTVLEGYPFPEVYIAAGKVDPKTGEGSEVIVDGQQRLTTLYQYFKDSPDIKVTNKIPKYSELEEDKQIEFLEYRVVVRDMGNMPVDEIREVFKRINSTSYGLNAMELHNSRFNGEFKKAGEEISEIPFFEDHKIFTAGDIKRMNDVKYCLTMMIAAMSTYTNRDKELEEYLEKYNEEFTIKEKILSEFTATLQFIDKLNFDNTSRVFKKADFYSLFVEIHRAIYKEKVDLDASKVRANLDAFYNKVELASVGGVPEDSEHMKYYKAALQASNDRSSRITRGSLIRGVISEI
ncbi:DUF262 domain-containing protein [Desulfuromonas thiophila]|uniref:Uncharacterized conserved protein, contains ParB-like and HNH nuclease domains n=1 Tax=Desulfuromonas thiophila TaxID=57664 RepID=A0A1G7EAG3_9BACT|nr:DUF262 domain-containing protein [Desulfuromonas thiophila]SDE60639.1 Uncharacterized conserved protein, contains ParB-like and HNH nuclease domains [Desulfuromonas thiophila]